MSKTTLDLLTIDLESGTAYAETRARFWSFEGREAARVKLEVEALFAAAAADQADRS